MRCRHFAICSLGGILVLGTAWAQPAPPSQEQQPTLGPTAPLPPPRPDRAGTGEPPQQPSETAAPAPAESSVSPASPGEDTCPSRLTRMGVRFEERPPLQDGNCGASDVVLVSTLPAGIEVSPPSLMTCPLAEALAQWSVDNVAVEADRHLKAAPASVLIGTSYQCRNQRTGAKLSEHAFANAVDVIGFTFAGRPAMNVTARTDESPEAAFQSAIRAAACTHFTTVLGPGSDAAHGDHLHLDLRARKAGYRICQ